MLGHESRLFFVFCGWLYNGLEASEGIADCQAELSAVMKVKG